MTKKSFILVLVISIGIWFLSSFIQGYYELFNEGKIAYSFFGSSCILTGYPVAKCVNEFEGPGVYFAINIAFWFMIVCFIWKILSKVKKSS